MPQIITFSKVMLMYFYEMKVIKFGATCISDHLFEKTTLCFICILLQPSFQPAKITEMD